LDFGQKGSYFPDYKRQMDLVLGRRGYIFQTKRRINLVFGHTGSRFSKSKQEKESKSVLDGHNTID
jgi:hypothetical protein